MSRLHATYCARNFFRPYCSCGAGINAGFKYITLLEKPAPPPPFICPECGQEGHHITSADCIKALKERVAHLEVVHERC